jgi:hypothetical protein
MNMAPTLVAARTSLPPEGANFPWGGPAGNWAPTLVAARTALPPEGANFPWGGPAGNFAPTLVAAPAPGRVYDAHTALSPGV